MEKSKGSQRANAKSRSGKNKDPTMDFFNLGVEFKPKVIRTSKEIVDQFKKPTAPPIISQDEDDEFFDCEETSEGIEVKRNEYKYAEPIKAKESNLYQSIREKKTQKKSKTQDKEFSFSEIEENTIVFPEGPFSHGVHEDPQLGKYFDFKQKRQVNLPIMNQKTMMNYD